MDRKDVGSIQRLPRTAVRPVVLLHSGFPPFLRKRSHWFSLSHYERPFCHYRSLSFHHSWSIVFVIEIYSFSLLATLAVSNEIFLRGFADMGGLWLSYLLLIDSNWTLHIIVILFDLRGKIYFFIWRYLPLNRHCYGLLNLILNRVGLRWIYSGNWPIALLLNHLRTIPLILIVSVAHLLSLLLVKGSINLICISMVESSHWSLSSSRIRSHRLLYSLGWAVLLHDLNWTSILGLIWLRRRGVGIASSWRSDWLIFLLKSS